MILSILRAWSRAVLGLMALLVLNAASAAVFENLYTVTVPLQLEVIEGQAPLTEED